MANVPVRSPRYLFAEDNTVNFGKYVNVHCIVINNAVYCLTDNIM